MNLISNLPVIIDLPSKVLLKGALVLDRETLRRGGTNRGQKGSEEQVLLHPTRLFDKW